MPEKTYRACLGLSIVDTTKGKDEQFLSVGVMYEGLKDAQRQIIQDVLLEHNEQIAAALGPVIAKLNAVGQTFLANDAVYQVASANVSKLKGKSD